VRSGPARAADVMRAARFLGGGRINVEHRREPEPGSGEVLLEVAACALCGTDRGAYHRGSEVTPGHEVAGVVVAAGDGVRTAPGTRGVVYLVDFCGTCYCCRSGWTNMCLAKRSMYGFTADGGYADLVCVREQCFLPVSDDVPLELAPTLLDLYGTSGHALRRAGHRPSDRVAVVGCGPIGLGAIAVAAARGAAALVAIDLAPYRLELAARLGAQVVDARAGDPVAAARAIAPEGFGTVIEAAGLLETQAQAIALCAPAGRVVFVAHNHDPLAVRTLEDLIQQEKTLLGSEYFPIGEFDSTRELLESGALDPAPLVTHSFSLDDIEEAFETFMGGNSGKVIVRP
jgi:threonine 3-dehydrogenase